MTGHILRVESHYDDGMEKDSWFYVRPGLSAEDAHASLARRWRDAGYTFTRDKKTLTLICRCECGCGERTQGGESSSPLEESRSRGQGNRGAREILGAQEKTAPGGALTPESQGLADYRGVD